MQLFCLTYAGGTAAFYDQVEEQISDMIVVEKLEYAGHGARHKEPFYEDFSGLAQDMYAIIKQRRISDYSLIGYSMGSISVVEILCLIIKCNEIPLPKYVFLAAHGPVSMTNVLSNSDNIDEYVKERTIRFGGVPDKLINNKSFWRMYLPIYRNDYLMIEKYNFKDLDLSTDIPLIVFYSELDTPLLEMIGWKRFFKGKTEFIKYDGPHFFINSYCKDICYQIEKALINNTEENIE